MGRWQDLLCWYANNEQTNLNQATGCVLCVPHCILLYIYIYARLIPSNERQRNEMWCASKTQSQQYNHKIDKSHKLYFLVVYKMNIIYYSHYCRQNTCLICVYTIEGCVCVYVCVAALLLAEEIWLSCQQKLVYHVIHNCVILGKGAK